MKGYACQGRKGQEEVVGFVVVVVLVAVVFVFFLGFSSYDAPGIHEKTSQDLRHFLESIRVFTTDCELTEHSPLEFKDLINACYAGKTCTSGKKACDALNTTATTILTTAFPVGKEYFTKGYRFKIIYSESPENQEDSLISLSQGNCSSLSQRSADDFFPLGAGQITLRVNLCY